MCASRLRRHLQTVDADADVWTVQLSPFSAGRAAPHRTVGLDTRPKTRQAIVLLAVAPGALAVFFIASDPHVRFALGFYIGLLLVSCYIGVAWLRSMVYTGRHLDESADFWLAHEAQTRPRAFYVHSALATLGTFVLILALAEDATFVAGLCLAPTYVSASVVALMWGKVP